MAAWCRRQDVAERLALVPYQEAPAPPMTDEVYRACPAAVHVLTADGRVLRAGRAVLFIMAALGYRRLAWLLGTRPLIPVVEWGYGVVARHRSFFSRFMFTRE